MKSGTVEDYLKAIHELEDQEGRAKTTPLARKLNVRAGTVSEMIKRLSGSSPRLIDYRRHQGVRLTAAGKKAALNVIRRHRLLETFLHQTLGLAWDEVHEEAEVLEHHISTRVTDAIEEHLEFPRFDPHGEPIPDSSGKVAPRIDTRLSGLKEGDAFKVLRVVPQSRELLIYLKSLSIGIHTQGRVVAKAPLRGPVSVEIETGGRANAYSLGRDTADQIYVEKRQASDDRSYEPHSGIWAPKKYI